MTATNRFAALGLMCLAMLCGNGTAQQPAPARRITRLHYELPVDALQRTLLRDTTNTMESLLQKAVDAVKVRVATATVERRGAAAFTVDLPTVAPSEVTAARQRIESIGTLELRIIAREDYKDAFLDLAAERIRLQKWLQDGGLAKVQKDPWAIRRYRPKDPTRIRWVPRTIRADNGRWAFTLSQLPATREATVRAFSDEQWNNQRVPAARLGEEDARLVELVAINMHETSFSHEDVARDSAKLTVGQNGEPGVQFDLKEARRKDYTAWTRKHIRHASAVIVNDELISSPVFVAQIVGAQVIRGQLQLPQAQSIISALQSGALPARPTLLRQEVVTPKDGN